MGNLFLGESVRTIERAWIGALGGGVLMQRAAHAVAQATARLARLTPRGTPIVALVGPGNNGGDALAALALLRERGFAVHALALSTAEPTAADARDVWAAWTRGGHAIERIEAVSPWLARDAIFIDGLFGIGLARPLDGAAALAVHALRDARARVVCIDVPSGLSADTGAVLGGADGIAVRGTHTVTMIADKPGLHTGDALDHVGTLEVADLAVTPSTGPGASALAPDGQLFTENDARAAMPGRARNSNKGSYGTVVVVGGAAGTTGAALLAGLGAQAAGAGKVYLASPDARVFDPGQPQLMTRAIDAPFDDANALCVGCGLGVTQVAAQSVLRACQAEVPLVLDADALNLAAHEHAFGRRIAHRRAPTVLTPHPLEAARLLGGTVSDVQGDRVRAARRLAAQFNATVILKGAGSVVASANGFWSIIDAGAPALATAGTGDVLAGVVAALLARGLPAPSACCLGAWLHAYGGELWTSRFAGGTGLSAAHLPHLIIEAMGRLSPRA